MYIYMAEKDDFSRVPAEIMRSLGKTELAMELELTADKKLAREDASAVINNLETNGFHLQLPRDISVEQIMVNIAKRKIS